MKRFLSLGLVFSAGIGLNAFADCNTPQVTGTALSDLLSGKTVCGQSVPPGERYQEVHLGTGSGTLREYAKGPTDPVDPSHDVGNWSVNTDASTVTYDYDGGSSYTFTVHDNGGSYSFCLGTSERATGIVQTAPPCGI